MFYKKYKYRFPRKLKKEFYKLQRYNKSALLPNYIMEVTSDGVIYKCKWYEGYIIDGKINRNTIRLIYMLDDELKSAFNDFAMNK